MLGHRPVIVKMEGICTKGGWKLSTIFLSCKVFHDWPIIKLVGLQIHIPKLYFSRSHIFAMPIAYLILYITLSNFSKNYIFVCSVYINVGCINYCSASQE